MSGSGTPKSKLDPRRLTSLAKAARQAGITRLRVGDVEFDLSPLPTAPVEPVRSKRSLAPPPIPEARPAPGSTEWVLQRFSKTKGEN